MKTKIFIGLLIAALLVLVGFNLYWMSVAKNTPKVVVEKVVEEKPVVVVNQKDYSDLIIVDSPKVNDKLPGVIEISGKARGTWFFEASFPIVLFDGDGNLVAQVAATTTKEWMTTEFVPFTAKINFNVPKTSIGRLVFVKDNPSGLKENDASFEVSVTLLGTNDLQEVKLFYHNDTMNLKKTSCTEVFAVKRLVEKTDKIATSTITELLKGPKTSEQSDKFTSLIPVGTRLNSVKIVNGTATVDFNEKLDEKIGGSCLVTGIRAEIEQTLLQFPTIQKVIISRNGNVEEVLQP